MKDFTHFANKENEKKKEVNYYIFFKTRYMAIERILNISITYETLLHCIVMHNILKDFEGVTGRF